MLPLIKHVPDEVEAIVAEVEVLEREHPSAVPLATENESGPEPLVPETLMLSCCE